ncbi:MAG: hypothetical protein H7Y42_17140 [Chitinophagaceae bacterium]|nr:hypothetical protein [Chitinophagaceae bacterium]
MKKGIAIAGMFCLTGLSASTQNLSGFWKGSFNMQGCFPNNNIELQVTMKGDSAGGDSYHYQDIDNYVKKKFRGRYNPEQKKLFINEGIVTTYHIPRRCVICVKEFQLVYSREGDIEILKGQWGGNVLNTNADCGIGSIKLTRVKESAFKEIPEIKVDTGTIRLDFYDNAEIDGDSITIKVNNKVVLTHQRLGAKPITTYIRVDAGNTFHEVEMIGENLGSIPPNTALLIITAGTKHYKLFLNSTETKSAKVRFLFETEASAGPPVKTFL